MNFIDKTLLEKINLTKSYYEILGCDPTSSEEQINTEFKIKAKEFHPDKCHDGEREIREEKFKILLEAKNTLTNPDLRNQYDAWRSSGLSINFHQWLEMKKSIKTTMHWGTPKSSGRMLHSSQSQPYRRDEVQNFDLRSRFQNYEI